jgi:hypothetical protein
MVQDELYCFYMREAPGASETGEMLLARKVLQEAC